MYEKEIDLEEAIKIGSNHDVEGIYYILADSDYCYDGLIDGENELEEQLEFDKSILESPNKYLELAKVVLDNRGEIFCMCGFIFDNSEIGEEGFIVYGKNGDIDVDVNYKDTMFTTGGYGFFIKKINDKYMCDYGVYSIQPSYPHGPADESFEHISSNIIDDPVGKFVLKELESIF